MQRANPQVRRASQWVQPAIPQVQRARVREARVKGMVELAIPKSDVAILRDAPASVAINRARVAVPPPSLAV